MNDHRKSAVVLLSGGSIRWSAPALRAKPGSACSRLPSTTASGIGSSLKRPKRIAEILADRHIVLPLDMRAFGGSALTDDIAVPKGGVGNNIPVTLCRHATPFPLAGPGLGRGAAARRPVRRGNAVDIRGYPDAAVFIEEFERLARLATKAGDEGEGFTIHAPLLHMTKADIALKAARLGLDAGLSHSCYDPGEGGAACGLCDACRLRARGFEDAGLPDPTRYVDGAGAEARR